MSNPFTNVRFAVLPLANTTTRPTEFARTMMPHPLAYQEFPYHPEYTIYNRRLTAMTMTNGSAEDAYWKLRRGVILRHTGELPIEISGPDAEALLNRAFTRDVSKNKVGRCSYQIACAEHGGVMMDGVLVRLAEDRFWYGQADGDLTQWLKAYSQGMDVQIFDPNVWVSQIQGPQALKVLEAAVDGDYPQPFRYFDAAWVSIAGQKVVVTRTGFTNELGWEVYFEPTIDAIAVGERILEAGKPFGLAPVAVGGARRIEGGLLNAGYDFDEDMTPFEAGLGAMVALKTKDDFIGKQALEASDQRTRTWGLRVADDVARIGRFLTHDGVTIGRICSSAWSPFQKCGVAIMRADDPGLPMDTDVEVLCYDGKTRKAEMCELPMYDSNRDIPRGKLVDIPDLPNDDDTGWLAGPG